MSINNKTIPNLNFKIWIDADACPKIVKEIIFKASFRLRIQVILVGNNYMAIPKDSLISSVQVEEGDDVADFYIVENIVGHDLVITADIPLAALVVGKGATAINPRGELYTEENISERLSMRNFMHELRGTGVDTGGSLPFGTKDKAKFANSLNRLLEQLMKK